MQPPKRRTQEERRAATRTALLDATLDCLIEFGYAGTTTTRIVERAGVSLGGFGHHFQTKANLMAEAVAYQAERRAGEFRRELHALPAGDDRVEAALDLLWKVHSGRLLRASLELWVAARTDPELRASLLPVEQALVQGMRDLSRDLFGSNAGGEHFDANVETALAAVEGIAVVGVLITGEHDTEAIWRTSRERLIALFDSDKRQVGSR